MFRLVWYQAESDPVSPSLNSQDDRKKRQTDQPQRRSVVVNGDSNTSYIDTLFPGTLYVIEMTSISYGVESNKTFLTLRTRNYHLLFQLQRCFIDYKNFPKFSASHHI